MRVGEPSPLFGHTWTVTRWVEGDPADHAPITRVDAEKPRARHPAGRVAGRVRRCARRWRECRRGPGDLGEGWRGAPVWLHGDLRPANVIVRDGTLSGYLLHLPVMLWYGALALRTLRR